MRKMKSIVALGAMLSFGMAGNSFANGGAAESEQRTEAEQMQEIEPVAGQEVQTVKLDDLDQQQLKKVQQALQQQGLYEGRVDGKMNEQTRSAIKIHLADRFVKEHRKLEEGEISMTTITALGLPVSEVQPVGGEEDLELQEEQRDVGEQPAQPGQGEIEPMAGEQPGQQEVREAQERLQEQGFYQGTVDGIQGPQTQDAVRQFQEAQGLEVTGELDQETLDAMGIDSDEAQQEGIQPESESPDMGDQEY